MNVQRFKPHAYQQRCVDMILDTPKCGLFLDMGLGKTAITLSALAELIAGRFEVHRVLIVAPKKVAEATWQAEALKWADFNFLKLNTIMGTVQKRLNALGTPANVYIINRDCLKWLVDIIGPANWPFDMVVLDESTSFKSAKTARFKALKRVRAKINRLVLLSGTPSPNSIADLWSQIYLLDGGERLGASFTAFRARYFNPAGRMGQIITSWEAHAGADAEITEKIKDICISMKSEDYLTLPDCITDDKIIKLSIKAQRDYDELERNMILETADAAEISVTSAAALSTKLLQLAGGAVYDGNGRYHYVHDCKLEAYTELVEALNGEPCLTFYNYQHERDRILEALKGSGLNVRVYKDRKDLDDWNSGLIDVLLAHPASTAYGLNMQAGGHHVIWYGLTWNFELYSQANKRLHRQGQEKPVFIHRLIVDGTRDEDVAAAIQRKDGAQAYVLESLKARIDKVLKRGTK